MTDSLSSLKQIIDCNQTLEECPEQFCFGLLAHFDIADLEALTQTR